MRFKAFFTLPVILCAGVLLVAGCSNKENSPISSLDESTPSQKYNNDYWTAQEQGNSDVWQQAMKICKGRDVAQYPNCQYINSLEWFYNAAHTDTTYPAYNNKAGFGKMPSFGNGNQQSSQSK